MFARNATAAAVMVAGIVAGVLDSCLGSIHDLVVAGLTREAGRTQFACRTAQASARESASLSASLRYPGTSR